MPNFLLYMRDKEGKDTPMIVQAPTGTDAAGYGEEIAELLDYDYDGWFELQGEPHEDVP